MHPNRLPRLIVLVAIVSACSTGGSSPPTENGDGSTAPSPGGKGRASAPVTVPPTVEPLAGCRTLDQGQVRVVAEALSFDTDCIAAPAGWGFIIILENRDGTPHDIAIEDSGGQTRFDGEALTDETGAYTIPPLDAGEHTFHCTVHPQMRGTIQVS